MTAILGGHQQLTVKVAESAAAAPRPAAYHHMQVVRGSGASGQDEGARVFSHDEIQGGPSRSKDLRAASLARDRAAVLPG